MRRERRGFTLVELIVVLAVMSMIALVSALGARTSLRVPEQVPEVIESVRRAAVARGRDTTVVVSRTGSALLLTVLRDGRVIVDSAFSTHPRQGVE